MPRESTDTAPNYDELVFLLAIAGRIDAQSKLLAKKLHKNRFIYHSYAILDSLSSSFSMLKWFFELCMPSNDSDYMHDAILSPLGVVLVLAETLFLTSFSLLASVYESEKNDSTKKFIANAWPYFRDVMKGLKNAYKGWKSVALVMSSICEVDLKGIIIPVGFVLGILVAANRFWIRSMFEPRKKKKSENEALLIEIEQLSPLMTLDRDCYLSRIGFQNDKERLLALFAVGAGGLFDGIYLYLGVVSLSVFAPSLLIAMSVLSFFYTLSCAITRIYEEYDLQLSLVITQTKCKQALVAKTLEFTYAQLILLTQKEDSDSDEFLEINCLKSQLCDLIAEFDQLSQTLKKQSTHSYWTAALLGMKHGLYAYAAVSSILFMISSVFLVTATLFPPVLLAVFISSGLVLMAGFTAYTLRSHFLHLQKQKEMQEKEHPFQQLMEMKKNIETEENNPKMLSFGCFLTSLKDGLALDPSPKFYFQEWFEVLRSLASGLSKGKNFSIFATLCLQEVDCEGHYQDTPVMAILAAVNALIFSLTLGLRALARGLGRSDLGTPNSSGLKSTELVERREKDCKETGLEGESAETSEKETPDSPPRTTLQETFYSPQEQNSYRSQVVFFGPSTKNDCQDFPHSPIPHSPSEPALHLLEVQFTNKALGLG